MAKAKISTFKGSLEDIFKVSAHAAHLPFYIYKIVYIMLKLVMVLYTVKMRRVFEGLA